MTSASTRSTGTLSPLIDADTLTFEASVPKLDKEDLVRLVGLLQQAMLEEERRFTQLSQCLEALNYSLMVNPTDSNTLCQYGDDDHCHTLTGPDDHVPCCVRFRNASTNGQFGEHSMTTMESKHSLGPVTLPIEGNSLESRETTGEKSLDESPEKETNHDTCLSKLSIQWDNTGTPSSTTDEQGDSAILRLQIGDDGGITNDKEELETKMRSEKQRCDYLARELCMSQSRLAQLVAKNMKVFNVQQQRRQHCVLDDQNSPPSTVIVPAGAADHSDSLPSTSPANQQQTRKSLSALHKEKKLKELTESSSTSSVDSCSKVDILRQQALQTVLTDILAGSGADSTLFKNSAADSISPESGYNSSTSLKSPSPFPVRQAINQQGKPSESELDLRRQRILEQVRNHRSDHQNRSLDRHRQGRSSGPVNQQLLINRSPESTPCRESSSPSDQQRPLKSILKKRPTDHVLSCSVENGIGRQRACTSTFALRSSSYSDETPCNNGIGNMITEEAKKDPHLRLTNETSLNQQSRRISMSDTMTMIRTQSIDQPASMTSDHRVSTISDQPVSTISSSAEPSSSGNLHGSSYPSPTTNGGPSKTAGKQELPDVVMPKVGEGSGIQRSPQTSNGQFKDRSNTESNNRSIFTQSLTTGSQATLKKMNVEHQEPPRGLSKEAMSAENDAFRQWDPRPLITELYKIRYEGHQEVSRKRFVDMEGPLEHLPMNMRPFVASETMWRTHYFRTNEGKLQWFEDKSDTLPFGEMALAGAEIDVDKNAYTFVLKNPIEGQLLTVRYPPHLLDKWRSSLLTHASASSSPIFVKPVYPPISNEEQNVCVIEIGSCSIRAGVLTSEPSLPQVYFPSIACIMPDGKIVPGVDSLSPSIRHDGTIVHPVTPTQLAVNRYSMDSEVVKHLFRHAFEELRIDPSGYEIMLSVPQNAPVAMIGDMMRTLLADFGVRGIYVSKQPFLVLYAYDVTTGVVVDFGDRLNIVPVIDGYVVQSAIVSLPYGGHNVSAGLRTKLIERNWTPYSFMSEVEKYVLRYIMEKTCYIASDFDEEAEQYDRNPSQTDTYVSIEQFNPTDDMLRGYNVDSSRFSSPEGIFKPKRWGFDIDGLHKLVYHAIQGSPLDSRRVLYRNIYLAGGASLIPGLAERLEMELAPLVASSVQVRVITSPWRDHAAYIGAQVIAGGIQFEQQLIRDTQELEKFIRRLYTANF